MVNTRPNRGLAGGESSLRTGLACDLERLMHRGVDLALRDLEARPKNRPLQLLRHYYGTTHTLYTEKWAIGDWFPEERQLDGE
jgi:hypothetical protein